MACIRVSGGVLLEDVMAYIRVSGGVFVEVENWLRQGSEDEADGCWQAGFEDIGSEVVECVSGGLT